MSPNTRPAGGRRWSGGKAVTIDVNNSEAPEPRELSGSRELGNDLMRAYHQTSFFADTPRGRIRLRIREKSAELEAILFAEGAREWAYVTACNPGSRPLSHRENVRRQEALEREVSGRGLVFLRGEGVGDDGQWPPEPSLLILGIARDQAVDLGGRFGQKAIVFGETGGSPELLASGGGP